VLIDYLFLLLRTENLSYRSEMPSGWPYVKEDPFRHTANFIVKRNYSRIQDWLSALFWSYRRIFSVHFKTGFNLNNIRENSFIPHNTLNRFLFLLTLRHSRHLSNLLNRKFIEIKSLNEFSLVLVRLLIIDKFFFFS
jgi:hypothetical protein